ncbi:MAF1, partial [Cordylochernes scorpioides]
MKYLENTALERISSALTFDTSVSKIITRLESYSCKLVAEEKKLYKVKMVEDWKEYEEQALSPPEHCFVFPGCSPSVSAGTISNKTLFYLIATLNASFCPDYDFSQAHSEEFSQVPDFNWAKRAIDDCLYAGAHEQYKELQPHVWSILDQEISMADCDIYRLHKFQEFMLLELFYATVSPVGGCSYNPELEPFGDEGCLWTFNYFFYNKKLKRIVFFTCKSI